MELFTPGAIIRGATKRDLCGLFPPVIKRDTKALDHVPVAVAIAQKGETSGAIAQKAALETSVNLGYG